MHRGSTPRRSAKTARSTLTSMRISVAADERTGVADAVVEQLRARGHEPVLHGALSDAECDDWAWCSEAAGRDVAEGRAEQAVVCCWTGTGASIAANKVGGVRAAVEAERSPRVWRAPQLAAGEAERRGAPGDRAGRAR